MQCTVILQEQWGYFDEYFQALTWLLPVAGGTHGFAGQHECRCEDAAGTDIRRQMRPNIGFFRSTDDIIGAIDLELYSAVNAFDGYP